MSEVPIEEPIVFDDPSSGSTILICEPDRVPGWLDENGNPTSCVENNPHAAQPEMPVIIPTAPVVSPEELALTGWEINWLLPIAIIVAGIASMLTRGKKC